MFRITVTVYCVADSMYCVTVPVFNVTDPVEYVYSVTVSVLCVQSVLYVFRVKSSVNVNRIMLRKCVTT